MNWIIDSWLKHSGSRPKPARLLGDTRQEIESEFALGKTVQRNAMALVAGGGAVLILLAAMELDGFDPDIRPEPALAFTPEEETLLSGELGDCTVGIGGAGSDLRLRPSCTMPRSYDPDNGGQQQ